jgi:hypothetical protein
MQSLETLQAQLAERIEKIDQERKERAAAAAKEREAILLEAELERKARLEEYQAKVAKHEEERKAKEQEAEKQRIAIIAERVASEQKQQALDEALRLQTEKLQWLEKAISDAEFSEEQYRKEQEAQRVRPVVLPENENLNVEHPAAPLNTTSPGEAVSGTDGNTPETPLMSAHLRQILRQATRA